MFDTITQKPLSIGSSQHVIMNKIDSSQYVIYINWM